MGYHVNFLLSPVSCGQLFGGFWAVWTKRPVEVQRKQEAGCWTGGACGCGHSGENVLSTEQAEPGGRDTRASIASGDSEGGAGACAKSLGRRGRGRRACQVPGARGAQRCSRCLSLRHAAHPCPQGVVHRPCPPVEPEPQLPCWLTSSPSPWHPHLDPAAPSQCRPGTGQTLPKGLLSSPMCPQPSFTSCSPGAQLRPAHSRCSASEWDLTTARQVRGPCCSCAAPSPRGQQGAERLHPVGEAAGERGERGKAARARQEPERTRTHRVDQGCRAVDMDQGR